MDIRPFHISSFRANFYLKFAQGLQIRIGGFKGMVSLDPTLEGEVLHLRKSMKKFESPHRSLEVVGFTGPLQGYLNRQISTIIYLIG